MANVTLSVDTRSSWPWQSSKKSIPTLIPHRNVAIDGNVEVLEEAGVCSSRLHIGNHDRVRLVLLGGRNDEVVKRGPVVELGARAKHICGFDLHIVPDQRTDLLQ